MEGMPREIAGVLAADCPRTPPSPQSGKASWTTEVKAGFALILLFGTLLCLIPDKGVDTWSFMAAIGLLAVWRYGWMFVHLVRSHIYLNDRFPALREQEELERETLKPTQIYVLITSYRIDHHTTFQVYDALIANAAQYGVPTVIVASLTDETDIDVLNHVMANNKHPENVQVRCLFQKGDGKRSAMADALRSIARDLPSRDSVLVMMDGDILLPDSVFEKSMGFFALEPDLGALTTDNRAVVEGGCWTKEWYDLRYAQRQLVMSSVALSRQLMVLTGRYSVFRGDVVLHRAFVEAIESDQIDHWRFGQFRFLSGDDKSSWFWLVKQGRRMRYLPDVVTYGFEALPNEERWFQSTTALMRRWYGNMLRSSGRAIALGPGQMGFFLWWCLIDQRLSMWTTQVGPFSAVLLAVCVHPGYLVTYLFWITLVRLLVVAVVGVQRRRISLTWPFLLYYSQLWGAILKTYVSFRVNQQKWTRQNISAGEPAQVWARTLQRLSSHCLHAGYVSVFVMVLAVLSGAMQWPQMGTLALVFGSEAP